MGVVTFIDICIPKDEVPKDIFFVFYYSNIKK